MTTALIKPEPIRHDGRRIAYRIAHRPRVTRRIHLEIDERGHLCVVAPRRLSHDTIHRTLQRSAVYVARFLDEARARRANHPRPHYVDGERHFLLGRRYPLEIRVEPDGRPGVRWMSDRIRVTVTGRSDSETVRGLLLTAYRELALEDFAVRVAEIARQAAWTRRRPPPLRVRRMKASWGTCSVDGVITLNPLLMQAPAWCIDYVIAHEICHLREHNHSERFYALQDRLCPRWRRARQFLHDKGQAYLQL